MTALAGPFLIVCCLLGLGGVAKLVAPAPASRALRGLGVPAPTGGVRALGAIEGVLAVAAIVLGGTVLPAAVGTAYVLFAAFVVAVIRAGDPTSCGCFGRSATPPSWLHVAVNLASAAVALASMGTTGLRGTLDGQVGAGIPLIGMVIVGTYALFLLLTALPIVLAPPRAPVTPFAVRTRPGTTP